MILAFVTVSAVLGSSAVRGLTALFIGIFIGLVGIDLQTGQARFTFGVQELTDKIDVIIVAVGLFAVGETLYMAARRHAGKDEIIPLRGSSHDEPRGMVPLLEAVAARHSDRLSHRRDAGGRGGSADVPQLLRREEAIVEAARNSGAAPSRASRGRRPPTTHRPQACSCRC